MRLLDKKFRENKKQFIIQSLLAGVAVAAALTLFDVVRHPVIIASFGASSFIAFTVPHMQYSSPRNLVGGYVIGVIVGCTIHFVSGISDVYFIDKTLTVIAGGIAVAIAVFLMTITDTEHAPATSIALGFVINDWDIKTVVLVLAGIVIISAVQRALRPRMIDLL
ncbi:MAG: HPP family protein [Candidatus Omnitrophota bacterium]|jgi:CBS-domain-containing membrane protein